MKMDKRGRVRCSVCGSYISITVVNVVCSSGATLQ